MIFFSKASETLKELSGNSKYIGATAGFIAVLHTWGQTLTFHPHLHCIVTGGGLSKDRKQWIHSRNKFLFPVRVMGKLFRGKFLSYFCEAYSKGNLSTDLKQIELFALTKILYRTDWVVYSKPPFSKVETVFEYLARYTHRIAISNHRIIKIENDKVFFSWRDYADSNKKKIMSLDAHEFIRRFLLHVLPVQYVKVRHYGIFGNKNRKVFLDKSRQALGISTIIYVRTVESWKQTLLRLTGCDIDCCPFCKKGKMFLVKELGPLFYHGP